MEGAEAGRPIRQPGVESEEEEGTGGMGYGGLRGGGQGWELVCPEAWRK